MTKINWSGYRGWLDIHMYRYDKNMLSQGGCFKAVAVSNGCCLQLVLLYL